MNGIINYMGIFAQHVFKIYPVVAYINNSFFMLLLNNNLLYDYSTVVLLFLIYSPADRHSVFFPVLAIMSKATMNVLVGI